MPINVATDKPEGLQYYDDALTLDLSDDDVERIISDRVQKSETSWNEELHLDAVQKQNEKVWLNQTLSEDELYDFQVPYKDNRVFTSIEQLVPLLLSHPPQPLVTQANDTEASEDLANDLGEVLLAKYEDLYLKAKFMMVARHLLIGLRYGVMKYRWDSTVGRLMPDGSRKGDVAVDALRPQRVVLDKKAMDKDDIPLIGEYQSCTLEELMFRFPAKKDEIWNQMGVKRGVSSQLASKVGYVETWFTYYGADGEKKEGLAWKMDKIVLDKMKNPHWNYDETKLSDDGKPIYTNFFDRPRKPYIIFNHLNLGRYVVDDTSISEQAQPLQDVLNKRGRQIVENADQASSGTVFNSDMISAETVAQLTGNPAEKALVKGDVRQAAMRLPTSTLEPYVLEDKRDARDEIDNIFGTRDPLRDRSNNVKTVGQTVISQRQDMGRLQTLATAIEDGADMLYKGLTQMFKVFYDEEDIIKYTGTDGSTSFINFSQDKIEDGVSVRVKTGSVLPDDPAAKQDMGVKLAATIDPLSLGELLSGKDALRDPEEFAKRVFLFHAAPDKYYSEILGEDPEGNVDAGAASHIQQINQGQPVEPQAEPTSSHMAQHQAFVQAPQFQQLPPQIQQLHLDHMKQEAAVAKQALGQKTPQPANQPPAPGGQGFVQNAVNYIRGK